MIEGENSVCSVCASTDSDDAPVFSCGRGHHWCRDCVGNMCKDAPHQCPFECEALLDRSVLEGFVDPDNLKSFREATLAAIQSAAPRPGESARRCQVCNHYIEVESSSNPGGVQFACQYSACSAYQRPIEEVSQLHRGLDLFAKSVSKSGITSLVDHLSKNIKYIFVFPSSKFSGELSGSQLSK